MAAGPALADNRLPLRIRRMSLDPVLLLTLAAVLVLLVLLWRQGADQARLRLTVEQALAGQRADGDSVRSAFQSATADTAARIAALDGPCASL